jgi:spore germination protein YaaH
MHLLTKKLVALFCGLSLTLSLAQTQPLQAALSDPPPPQRIAGNTLYDTALEISRTGWDSAPSVVLATGENFPDALAGSVLARQVNGPLLLTPTKTLSSQVLEELDRLNTQKVYILGGKAAVSTTVQETLEQNGYAVDRLWGEDQYGTAAEIAKVATPSSNKAFLVNGKLFPDALSIASYAAANKIPLLMTESNQVPDVTIKALQQLGVQEVTLIGGKAVISDKVQQQLEALPTPIRVTDRIAGWDQYETNTEVLTRLSHDTSKVYIATGERYPDALAGAALASKNGNPILLVRNQGLAPSTTSYIEARRSNASAFVILGGFAVVSQDIQKMLGESSKKISLQYLQGNLNGATGMLTQVQSIPSPATDYVDILAPSWYYLDDTADASVYSTWDNYPGNYEQLVQSAHSRDLKVLPVIQSSWSTPQTVGTVLRSAELRTKLINNLETRINSIGADGIVIDFEYMENDMAPHLTAFMEELYARFHAQNKLVVMAVMSRTGEETWYDEFNYYSLSQAVDYLHIMTYDYSTSYPGPLAPIDWISNVLYYAQSQGVDMNKVLLGLPYYATDWWKAKPEDTTYNSKHRGLHTTYGPDPNSDTDDIDGAMERLAKYNATLERDASQIPYFKYTVPTGDEAGEHIVYFDDVQSWSAKLALIDQYKLGGVGAWSLYWTINPETGNKIYPMLKSFLR